MLTVRPPGMDVQGKRREPTKVTEQPEANIPRWPLLPDHLFAPTSYDLRHHTGRESLTDLQAVARWQRAYNQRHSPSRPITVNGIFDGPTQKAVIWIQKRAKLPVTGTIDRYTWEAVWQLPMWWQWADPDLPKVEHEPRTVSGKRIFKYWTRLSRDNPGYGMDPNAPWWYPGKPFGRHERGYHVRHMQQLLGIRETGCVNEQTARRLRGFQRLMGLPVSGVCDAVTAAKLDPDFEPPSPE